MFEKGFLWTGGEWYITVAKFDLVLWIAIAAVFVCTVLAIMLINKVEENKKMKREIQRLNSALSISTLRKNELREKYEGKI